MHGQCPHAASFHPEKAFAMRADYVDKNPNATKALLMAVMEAQMWCEKAENKEEMAKICSGRKWINAPLKSTDDVPPPICCV